MQPDRIRLDDLEVAGLSSVGGCACSRSSPPSAATTGQRDALLEEAAAAFRELRDPKGLSVVLSDQAQAALNRGELARARPLLEEGLQQARERGVEEHISSSLLDLGIVALSEGRHDDAAPLFTAGLESALRPGDRALLSLTLRGLGSLAAARGALERAARLAAAADAIDEQTGYLMELYERKAFANAMTPVAERAGDPEIAVAQAAGRAMSESAAAAHALVSIGHDAPSRRAEIS